MRFGDCIRAIKKLRPAYRNARLLREYCERLDCALGHMHDQVDRLEKQVDRLTPQASLNLVEINIVSHCNLNCRSCSHFSPLAEEEFLPVELAELDFARLASLSCGDVRCIHIMGGEPLLHPRCCDFLRHARRHFPMSTIRLVTNGILLPSQPDSFWSCLSRNLIELSPTRYPVDIDWKYVKDKCSEYRIPFGFFNNTDIRKTMTRFTLDLTGRQDPRTSFRDCDCANNTVVLHDGRMYPCEIIPTVRHFNRYFDEEMEVTRNDSIDIYEARSMNEILSFLSKPVPFCRHCNVLNRVRGIEWETASECSPPQMSEWADY